MTLLESLEQNIKESIKTVTYKDLTIEELRGSNYPDSKLSSVHVSGINSSTGIEYKLWFVHNKNMDWGNKFVGIGEKGKPYYSGCSKEENLKVKEALASFALAVRAKTGGNFYIWPGQGAIRSAFMAGTNRFEMLINLSDDAVNQEYRKEAKHWGKLKEWDRENRKYNPKGIPQPMELTHASVVDTLEHLQKQLEFVDLEITSTDYEGLTLTEFQAASLPLTKIDFLYDSEKRVIFEGNLENLEN